MRQEFLQGFLAEAFMKRIETSEYETLLGDIKNRIHKSQFEALKAVNKELITLYWDIGKLDS